MSEIETGFHLLVDKCKKRLWRTITPVFPYVRDGLLKLGIIYHNGRQPYPIGWIREGRTIRELIEHLTKKGFSNHFVAWVDDGEAISLRRLANFHWQYHLRIFNDGEIRAHYEMTPEAHPISHFKGVDMEPRRKEFLKSLEGWISDLRTEGEFARAGKTASRRIPAASRGVPVNG